MEAQQPEEDAGIKDIGFGKINFKNKIKERIHRDGVKVLLSRPNGFMYKHPFKMNEFFKLYKT